MLLCVEVLRVFLTLRAPAGTLDLSVVSHSGTRNHFHQNHQWGFSLFWTVSSSPTSLLLHQHLHKTMKPKRSPPFPPEPLLLLSLCLLAVAWSTSLVLNVHDLHMSWSLVGDWWRCDWFWINELTFFFWSHEVKCESELLSLKAGSSSCSLVPVTPVTSCTCVASSHVQPLLLTSVCWCVSRVWLCDDMQPVWSHDHRKLISP